MKSVVYFRILYFVLGILLMFIFLTNKYYYPALILLVLFITYFIFYQLLKSFNLMKENFEKVFCFFVVYTFLLYFHIAWIFKRSISSEGYLVIATYNGKTSKKTSRFVYTYYDTSYKKQHAFMDVPFSKYDMTKYEDRATSTIIQSIIYVIDKDCYMYKEIPSFFDLEKYKYPVKTINKNYELGNDSYEYAKYEPDIVYKYYGFNIVQPTVSVDSNLIYVEQLNDDKFYIRQKNHPTDTLLVYTNINPEFNTGWHICPDSLCTSENFDKVMDGGYGYLFRGKIYSKDETEQYWNLIEQYKLRLNK